jgi:monoamine oxidase
MVDEQWVYSAFRWADRDGPYSAEKALAWPRQSLRSHDKIRRRKSVCIVGGGIAGLAAAYELATLNHRVTLLEASARWGGRIFTYRFSDGTYGELGAMRIPQSHGYVRHYLDEFQLKTRPFVSENADALRYFRGEKRRLSEADQLGAFFPGIPDAYKTISPLVWITDQLDAITFPDDQNWEAVSNQLTSPELLTLEGQSIGQFIMSGLGGKQNNPELLAGPRLDAMWEYAGRVTQHLWLEQTSALHWVREALLIDRAGKDEIVGGMDLLVDAFLHRLRNLRDVEGREPKLHLNAVVKAITMEGEQPKVRWLEHDRVETEEFDFVICTTPARMTQQIAFDPGLAPDTSDALGNISYLSAGKTLMHCRKRYWELEATPIVGGGTTTDMRNQQCWYPSDNSERIEGSEILEREHKIDRTRFTPARWRAVSRERSHSPGVLLAAYMWGKNAEWFSATDDGTRDEVMRSCISKLHDQTDEYVDEIVHWSWDTAEMCGGGAFAWFGPGEQRRYQEALCRPVFDARGNPRVLFAGEHLAVMQGWIQGSLQSAIAACIHLLHA